MSSRKRKVVADEDEDPTKIDFETSEEVDVVPTFDQLKLREELLRGVYAYGMSECKEESQIEVTPMIVWRVFDRLFCRYLVTFLLSRIRETFCYSTACY